MKNRENEVSIELRQGLIAGLPLFATFTVKERAALAALMTEVHYIPGELIVEEDTLVDSVFIIVSGQAEVSRKSRSKHKLTKRPIITKVPVATLNPGEAIGLSSLGFFSTTGKRTATVNALSDMLLLKLNLKDLDNFFQKYPHLQTTMHAATENMLRMRLIKQSLPFSKLSHERLQWLVSKIEEISVPAGEIIFRQGEVGDRCYLIHSGQVEILVKEEDGTERQLATLKSPTLFGEATLITRSPRNATARAIDNCKLLILRHEYLSELIETEHNVGRMFMGLMVDRSRPLRSPEITAHQRTTEDGQEVVILKNPNTGNYFKLSAEGWFIWQQLDGKQTMQDITIALADQFDIFAPDVVAALISKLANADFISQVEINQNGYSDKQPFWVRSLLRIRRVLETRIVIGDADKWLTNAYKKGIHFLFSRAGQILIAAVAITGFVTFGFMTVGTIETFRILPHTWVLLVCLVPATLLSVALHELGHAFATKAFGHEVHYMGVGWYWFTPVAFTDTSDMWLSTRGPRIVVNLAGVYTDCFVAGFSALLILIISNPYIQAFLWLFALFAYINAFRMLSPLQELDGYYVLMDLLDQPQLRKSSVMWLVKEFPKALRRPTLFKKNIAEVSYWVACIIFLVLASIVTLLVQAFVLKIFGLHSHHYISLILPVLVVITSSLGIIADIRQAEGQA